MPLKFNLTIVWAQDSKASARLSRPHAGSSWSKALGSIPGRRDRKRREPRFHGQGRRHRQPHYAFLVGETEFDEMFGPEQERRTRPDERTRSAASWQHST